LKFRLRQFIALCRNIFFGKRSEQDLGEELSSYHEMLVEKKIGEGSEPWAARRAALIEMGGIEQIKEGVTRIRMGYRLETFLQDLRFALRFDPQVPRFFNGRHPGAAASGSE
jgi:hypothetical protein